VVTECRICGEATDLSIRATERMFGFGGEFWYDRCGSCGGLQLREIPENLSAFYPDNYYAFDTKGASPGRVRAWIRLLRDALVLGRARRFTRWIEPLLSPGMLQLRGWLERAGANRDSRILDVGCGDGAWLRRLRDQGYQHVLGVDPFIASPIEHGGKLLVKKGTLDDVNGEWDLIMFHHSLEHIADQRGTLARVADLLAPGGCCLIRIPIVSSHAWEEYRDRWVQLDAPRHLMLHSTRSLERLAHSVGLRVDAVVHDSTMFQFEGSELYRRDRPLTELSTSSYSRSQRRTFAARAAALNAEGRGDQAAFYLRRR
jgi:SAM-dependent methyltransferase